MNLLHTLILMIVLYYFEILNLSIALVIALISMYLISGLFKKSINFVYTKL
jgi:hypothetical protein